MKKIIAAAAALLLALSLLTACGSQTSPAAPDLHEVVFSGMTATSTCKGAVVKGNVVTINREGEYHLSGKLDNGQLVIDTTSDTGSGKVILYLDDADLTCLTAPVIYVLQAQEVELVLSEGTKNRLVSGTEADVELNTSNMSGGAIFSEDDVDIEGEGSLEIFGYLNNGITCKDDFKLKGGALTVFGANNGIKASESISLTGGSLAVTAVGDGMKTTSSAKEGKGFILIDGCDVSVSCSGDGISSETEFTFSSGSVNVTSDGDPMDGSCKAIKAKGGVSVSGGEMTLSSADHALHSSAGMLLSGGSLSIVSSDGKAIAAHDNIEISGGELVLSSTDDGIETSADITVSGGSLTICAGEDGLHAGEKTDGVNPATGIITFTGGSTLIDAGANPVNAQDHRTVNGGTLIAVGTPKKVKSFSEDSTQVYLSSAVTGVEGPLEITGEGFSASMEISRRYTAILVSAPELKTGSSYTISIKGAAVNLTA